MKYSAILIISLFLILSGCHVKKQWTATGGSRADGVVRLSYEIGKFEIPQLDENQGLDIAIIYNFLGEIFYAPPNQHSSAGI